MERRMPCCCRGTQREPAGRRGFYQVLAKESHTATGKNNEKACVRHLQISAAAGKQCVHVCDIVQTSPAACAHLCNVVQDFTQFPCRVALCNACVFVRCCVEFPCRAALCNARLFVRCCAKFPLPRAGRAMRAYLCDVVQNSHAACAQYAMRAHLCEVVQDFPAAFTALRNVRICAIFH